MQESNFNDIKEFWSSLDTRMLYLPEEIIAYHFYLLELAKKNKKQKEEKNAEAIIATYKKNQNRDMEEIACLKM